MSLKMKARENLLNTISEKLSEMFVEEYEKINNSLISINKYLEGLEVNYTYDYNKFCIDFMECSKKLVDNLSDEQLKNLDSNTFVSEVFSFMIKNKIYEYTADQERRSYLLAEFQLQKFLINR